MSQYDTQSTPAGLMLSSDLFFSSRVTAAADALGGKIEVVENAGQLSKKLAEAPCRCLILDLSLPGLDVAEVVASLPEENRPVVVAFGSHVLTERLQSARDAGCDDVLPKSRFVSGLKEILQRALS